MIEQQRSDDYMHRHTFFSRNCKDILDEADLPTTARSAMMVPGSNF
jgi:hypothetical protein